MFQDPNFENVGYDPSAAPNTPNPGLSNMGWDGSNAGGAQIDDNGAPTPGGAMSMGAPTPYR